MFHWAWDEVQALPVSVRELALQVMRDWGDTEASDGGIEIGGDTGL